MATKTTTAAPLSTPIPLAEEKKPKYWFFTSVNDGTREYPRMRLLANQYIPFDEVLGTYLKGDEGWNVQCSKAIRQENPAGTIFVSEEITIWNKCYHVGDGKMFALSKAGKDMREEYEFFKSGTVRTVEKKVVIPTAPATPKTGSLLESIKNNPTFAPPLAESGFYVPADKWYLLVRNIVKKENTMLVGPTGTGKTQLLKLIAQKLSLPIEIFDMGAMFDPIAGLLGVHRLEEGKSIFDYSRFSQVIQKPGIVVLDELSRPASNCNNILLPVTDDRRELPLEIAGSFGLRNIAVHPECVFIATANIGQEYSGTSGLDRALIDRFFPMEIDYMPKEIEAKILVARCGIKADYAKIVAEVADIIRRKASEGMLSTGISHRHTLTIGQLINDGFPLRESLEMVMMPLFDKTTGGERSEIKTILSSK